MRNSLPKSVALSGKVVLIIIAVAAATGGFTLGYFVGKNVSSPPPPTALKQSPIESGSGTIQIPNPDLKNEASPSPRPVGNKQLPSESPRPDAASPSVASLSPAPALKGAPKPQEKTGHGETAVKSSELRDAAKDARETSVSPKKKVLYTVQAGAFKNQEDADALKQTLEARGYRASVKKASNAKGAVLFKVIIGEFDTKKKAMVFALKLKKTSGLNTFAALKN